MCDFSTLPPHILTNVLLYLKIIDFRNAVQTCKSWYYASCDPKITNKIRACPTFDAVDVDFLSRPINNLRLVHPNMNKFRYRELFRNFGRTITELELFVQISTPRLFELFIHLPRIKTLKLYDFSKYTSSLNFHRCRKISRNCETIYKNIGNIQHLTIQVWTRDLELYKIFLNKCQNIEIFHWYWSGALPPNQGDFVNRYLLNPNESRILENTIELMIASADTHHRIFESLIHLKLVKLRRLKLGGISLNYHDLMFTDFCRTYSDMIKFGMSSCNDHHLHDICRYMKSLKSLEVENCDGQNSISEIKNLVELENLHMERREPVTDDTLIQLMDLRMHNLKSLSLNKISDDLLNAICNSCTNLDILILTWVDTHECEPIFKNLVNLRKLHLEFTEYQCHSSQMISSSVWNITKLTKLTDLYVDCYVPGITPDLIKLLSGVNLEFMDDVFDPMDEELYEELVENNVQQETDDTETNSSFDLSEFGNMLTLFDDGL